MAAAVAAPIPRLAPAATAPRPPSPRARAPTGPPGPPAAPMAAAVAAPIPRLAPVTTATRPRSQCAGSPMVCHPRDGTNHLPVEPLVSVQALFQVEMAFGVVTAVRTRNPGRPPDGLGGGLDVIGRHQET